MLGKLGWGARHGSQAKATPSRDVSEAERQVKGRGARDPDSWRRLAVACARARDYRGEYEARRKVSELLPEDLEPAFECGIAARKAGAVDEALDYFTRCLALQPKHASSHTQYAKTLDLAGMYDEALEHHREAIELSGPSAESLYHLGVTYARNGKDDLARASYEAALDTDPSFARAHELKRAVTLEPTRAEWHSNLGALFGEHRMFDEAIEEFSRALRLDPENAEARFNLGLAYLDCGLFETAIVHLKKASEVDPKNARAYYHLGEAYHKKRLYPKAIREIRNALEVNPDDSRAYYALGCLHNKMDAVDEAITAFERAIALAPDDSRAYYHLGIAYDKKGASEEARDAYRRSEALLARPS
jgi:tetratricopeptide (TPR) repeat protein